MESHILKHENDRAESFQPNRNLEQLIAELRTILEPADRAAVQKFKSPDKPVLAVVGCPRSGTTFLTQLIAATGAVSYPTNLLSRFAFAPYTGSLIQKMLLDRNFDHRDELGDLRSKTDFLSEIGKTGGALGINEFFHFWRRFFPNHDPGHVNESALEKVKVEDLRAQIAGIEAAFEKPFMSKAMMLQYNLDFFSREIPELFVIHITRNPSYVMQSISQSRIKYYGTNKIWWSVKPKEYDFLKDMDPSMQVAGQVLFTEQAICNQTRSLPASRYIHLNYEDLCENPHQFIRTLADRTSLPQLADNLRGIERSYPSGNKKRISDELWDELEECYHNLELGHGTTTSQDSI